MTEPVICPYCKHPARLVSTNEISGWSPGLAYLCRPCGAWVGCKNGTSIPLGTLANSELRALRREAFKALDELWKRNRSRDAEWNPYRWISERLGLPREQARIGVFDVAMCRRLLEACAAELSAMDEGRS